ncbi:MAG TPA: hypothetical protein VK043_08610 [Burkholderiales bacterium]|nr:hypothetical protein [Burkholderiales bacterium]
MPERIARALVTTFAALAATALVAGCAEKPQRVATGANKTQYNFENTQTQPLRHRTLNQGESRRLGV